IKGKILMAEDMFVDAVRRNASLRKRGYEVDIAKDGIEAIKKVQQNPNYDAILMNFLMPRANGFRATQFIRQVLAYDRPIIGFSVAHTEDHVDAGLSAGMDTYVFSNLGDDHIIYHLEKWLDNPKYRKSTTV
ncbi:MAG: response regulator, partial [Bacteroidota bacterium]